MKSEAVALPVARSHALDFVALAKPRLNFLVVATTCGGFYLATGAQLDLVVLIGTVFGTTLVSAGAAALNQVYERDVDGLMLRTRGRPLPAGRVQPNEALAFGVITSLTGLACLVWGTNVLAGALALATLVIYLAAYTPLKRLTPASTLVGAVPGALPPLIGWAAARGELGPAAWALFAIVFTWQIPHFFAIAWLCRDDYARARLPMLPVLDDDGHRTAGVSLLFAAALVPISTLPTVVGLTGTPYLVAALLLGAVFLGLTIRFAYQRSTSHARSLFFGSLIYLPLLWTLMIVNRTPGPWS